MFIVVLLLFCRDAYRGALSEEELDALDRAAAEKVRAMELLVEREEELRKLRDGLLTTHKVGIYRLHVVVCKFTCV